MISIITFRTLFFRRIYLFIIFKNMWFTQHKLSYDKRAQKYKVNYLFESLIKQLLVLLKWPFPFEVWHLDGEAEPEMSETYSQH